MHERIIGLYEENAQAWDRLRGRGLMEKPWLDRFAAYLPQGAAILDVGCGGGEPIGRYLIERGFRLTGIDSAPSLITMARERFPEQEWQAADMRTLDLGSRFDGIVAWHSSFHLPPEDQGPLLARLAAHLKPRGVLMFTSGPARGESIGEWMGEPLYHASLDPDDYRNLLAENGLAVLDHCLDDKDCGGATVWIAQMRPASGLEGSA